MLGACEWFDGRAFRHVLGYTKATGSGAANPFGADAEPDAHAGGYVLVEASGSVPEHDMAKLEAFLEGILEGGVAPANDSAAAVELARQAVADDAVLAQDMSQAATLWTLRELCPTALTGSGLSCYKYDISLPLKLFEPAMDATRQRLCEHGLREPDDAELVSGAGLGRGLGGARAGLGRGSGGAWAGLGRGLGGWGRSEVGPKASLTRAQHAPNAGNARVLHHHLKLTHATHPIRATRAAHMTLVSRHKMPRSVGGTWATATSTSTL